MGDAIVLYQSVGYVAAVLTVFEYFLGILTALAARAFLRGLWLLQLQKGRKTIVSARSRARRGLWRDILLTALGIWLLVSVALIENGLESTFYVSKHSKQSTYCIHLDRRIRPQVTREVIPAMDYSVEPWVVVSSQKIVCGPNADRIEDSSAIGSIGVGGRTDINGLKIDMFAPSCVESGAINPRSVKMTLTTLKVDANRLSMVSTLTNVAEIIPYSTNGINQSEMVENFKIYTEATEGPCISRNISALRTSPFTRWRSRYAQSRRVMQAVHNSICESHPTDLSSTRPLRVSEVLSCGNEGNRTNEMDIECIRSRLEMISSFEIASKSKLLFKAQLSNVSFLTYGMDRADPSYACVNSTVSVEYTVVDHDFFPTVKSTCTPKHPVIVPLGYEVISGHCERTIHALARAALMNSADAEWRRTQFSMLNRVQRYYLFLMSLSSSLFPLNNVDVQPTDVSRPCLVHEVKPVTLLRKNWTFSFFMSAFVFSILVMIAACLFRFYFSASSWEIGSGKWSLIQMEKHDLRAEDEDVDLEIIVGPPNRSELANIDQNGESTSVGNIRNEVNGSSNSLSQQGPALGRLMAPVVLARVAGRNNSREYTLRRVINRSVGRNLDETNL